MGRRRKSPRPVRGTRIRDGFEIIFTDIQEVERKGFTKSAVQRCINGGQKEVRGFTWTELNDAIVTKL